MIHLGHALRICIFQFADHALDSVFLGFQGQVDVHLRVGVAKEQDIRVKYRAVNQVLRINACQQADVALVAIGIVVFLFMSIDRNVIPVRVEPFCGVDRHKVCADDVNRCLLHVFRFGRKETVEAKRTEKTGQDAGDEERA